MHRIHGFKKVGSATDSGATGRGKGRGPSSALSLIEILVAVCILGVLGAIVIPAVKSTIETLKRSECVHALRQIGSLFRTYASDNAGSILFHSYNGPNTTVRWNDYLVQGGYLERTSKLQFCPGTSPKTYTDPGYVYGGISGTDPNDPYSFIPPGEDVYSRGIRLSAMDQPARYWLLTDSWSSSHEEQIYVVNAYPSAWGLQLRHGGRANVLFADGHVDALSLKEFRDLPYHPLSWGFDANGQQVKLTP